MCARCALRARRRPARPAPTSARHPSSACHRTPEGVGSLSFNGLDDHTAPIDGGPNSMPYNAYFFKSGARLPPGATESGSDGGALKVAYTSCPVAARRDRLLVGRRFPSVGQGVRLRPHRVCDERRSRRDTPRCGAAGHSPAQATTDNHLGSPRDHTRPEAQPRALPIEQRGVMPSGGASCGRSRPDRWLGPLLRS